MVRFRERLTGALLTLEAGGAVTVPERGGPCGDGLRAGTRALYAARHSVRPRDGLRIDLRGLEVEATGGDVTPGGFRAVVRGGTVAGLVARQAVVAVGFADLVARSTGRRLYYRLAVADGDAWYVLEGAKEVRASGGRRGRSSPG